MGGGVMDHLTTYDRFCEENRGLDKSSGFPVVAGM
jgi:hypothetical protein